MPRSHCREYASRTETNAVRINIRAHSYKKATSEVEEESITIASRMSQECVRLYCEVLSNYNHERHWQHDSTTK